MTNQNTVTLSQDKRYEVVIATDREGWLVENRQQLALSNETLPGVFATPVKSSTSDEAMLTEVVLSDAPNTTITLEHPLPYPEDNECILVKPNIAARRDGTSDDIHLFSATIGYHLYNDELSMLEREPFSVRLLHRFQATQKQLTRSNMQLGFDDHNLQRGLLDLLETHPYEQVVNAYKHLRQHLETFSAQWMKNPSLVLFNCDLLFVLDLKCPENSKVAIRQCDHPIIDTLPNSNIEPPVTLMSELTFGQLKSIHSWPQYKERYARSFKNGLANVLECSAIGFGLPRLRVL